MRYTIASVSHGSIDVHGFRVSTQAIIATDYGTGGTTDYIGFTDYREYEAFCQELDNNRCLFTPLEFANDEEAYEVMSGIIYRVGNITGLNWEPLEIIG